MAELNRLLPSRFAFGIETGKTFYDDPEYIAISKEHLDFRKRVWPDGQLYSNEELALRDELDAVHETKVQLFLDRWEGQRQEALAAALTQLCEIWDAHHIQHTQETQEKLALLASQQREKQRQKAEDQQRKDRVRQTREQQRREEQLRKEGERRQEQLRKERLKEQKEADKRHAEEEEERRKREDAEERVRPRPIPQNIRSEHTFILAPSGAGKTTLLEHLIIEDLKRPNRPAIIVIDPKGLMVHRLSRLAYFKQSPFIYFDPTTHPALNIFASASSHRAVQAHIIELFGYIFSAGGFTLTSKQGVDFSYVVRLLFRIKNANILTLLDILDNTADNLDDFPFKRYVEQLDPIAQRFFRNEFFTQFKDSKGQIKARLYMLLQHPDLTACLATQENNIDMADAIAKKKVVLINTANTILGDSASTFFGRYFIAATLNAALSRWARTQDRSFVSLVIDEFQEFADEVKTPQMLKMAREYNLGITMATQNLHSYPFTEGLRNTISTNTTTKYVSSPEGIDLNYMARDMRCDGDWLQQQKKTQTHARFACFVRAFTDHPMALSFQFGAVSRESHMSDEDHARILEANNRALASHSEPSSVIAPQDTNTDELPTKW